MEQNNDNDWAPILVLGVGNVLLTDEGVGVHAVRKLRELSLPSTIEIVDGGTMGFELLYLMENREKIILIDAVQTHEPPGTIFRFTPEQFIASTGQAKVSFHQLGIMDVFKKAPLIGIPLPETVIFGIQPGDLSMGTQLSPQMEKPLQDVITLVLKELNSKDSQN